MPRRKCYWVGKIEVIVVPNEYPASVNFDISLISLEFEGMRPRIYKEKLNGWEPIFIDGKSFLVSSTRIRVECRRFSYSSDVYLLALIQCSNRLCRLGSASIGDG